MNRVRWFHVSLPQSLRAIAATLSSSPLQVDGEMGFRIERVRSDSVEATYYERFTWTERLTDPFGRESSFERSGYKSVHFILAKKYPELELIDAPRGLTSFFSRLAEMTDFEVTVEPITVDVLSWATAFRRACATTCRVAAITVSNLNVEDGVTGRLTIASREKDVQAAMARLLVRRTYSVQKIEILFRAPSPSGSLVLAADGTVRTDSGFDPDILKVVRETLPSAE